MRPRTPNASLGAAFYLNRLRFKKLVAHLLLIGFVIVILLPVLSIALVSFDSQSSLASFWPTDFTLNHWKYIVGIPFVDPETGKEVVSAFPILTWLFNSLLISTATAILILLLSTTAAYALSRFRFAGRQQTLMGVMIIQMFPNIMAMVAFYFLLDRLGQAFSFLGTDTHLGLILVYLGGTPFSIWLIKGYFDTIPKSLEEAARLDGLSHWQVFTRIILPLSAPILAVVAILTFIGTFSDFILPSILLKSQDKLTFAVGIQIFIADAFSSRWGPFAAACLLGALPLAGAFISIHRFLIGGLAAGATKG